MTLPKTTRRVGVRKYKGRALAIKPQRDYALTDAEREVNDLCILADAETLARKLCGDLPYCRDDVKGWRIAGVIRTLSSIMRRIIEAKTTHRVRELERENAALRESVATQRRELTRLWVVESRYKGSQAFDLARDEGLTIPSSPAAAP